MDPVFSVILMQLTVTSGITRIESQIPAAAPRELDAATERSQGSIANLPLIVCCAGY